MAASRKLQAEIDRCLKKVSEGVDTFDDIWKKVHNATNNNQKEKYEADLKKEIKKLQRLRDQIKSWIASGEIKDKSQLLDYRKLIETQMERFKVVERETKTKAYSKEGLGAAQKLDPAQKEREEISSWLVTSIDALNLQTNKIEFELEHLSGGKKKKLDKDKQERSDELKNRLERHRFHIQKLESLLRMLDNLSVEVNQIKKIKDDVEYYIESSLEPGFQENEYIYDEISGLDDMEVTGVLQPSNDSNHDNETPISSNSVISPAPSPSHSVTLSNHSNDVIVNSSDAVPEKRKKDDLPKLIKPIPIKASNTNSISNTMVNSYNHHPSFNKQSQHITNNVSSTAMVSSSTVTTTSTPVFSSASFSSTLLTIPSSGQLSTSTITPTSLSTSISSGPISTSTSVPISILSSKFNQNSSTNSSNSVSHSNNYHNSTTGQGISNFAAVAAANTAQSSKYTILENGPVLLGNNSNSNNNNLISSNYINMNTSNSNSNHLASNANLLNQQNSNVYSMNFSSLSHSNSQNSQQNIKSLLNDPQSNNRTLSTSTANISNISLMNGPISNSSTLKHPIVSSAFTVKDDKMTSLKSIAQQAIDRAGIEISTFTTGNTNNNSSNIVVNNTNNSGTNKQNDPTKTILNSTATSVVCNNQASNSVSSITTKFDTSANNISVTSISASNNKDTTTQLTETFIRPILGVAPLATDILPPENHQLQLIESASCHMPLCVDSEHHHFPLFKRTPYSVPDYYIQPLYVHMDNADYYQRLSPETLFFIFYFMEGTKAQYFAARALKKLSWRFHTKYMMWFQRHEEPKCINDDYEQGTYIYFDYEKWAQRKKDGFTFEYKYLEDRDLN